MDRIDSVRLIDVIVVKGVKGQGTEKDPVRRVVEYWTKDGKKIAEIEDAN